MVDNLITLYDSNERNFTTNGLGMLVDASECTVEEELNGAFELTMSYPIDGQHYTDLGIGKIIFAKPNRQSEKEPFRIYSISTPLSGTVTVKAQHISYDLSGYILPKFNTDYSESGEAYATGPRTAFARIESELAKIPEYSDFPFTFYTDSDEDYAGQDVMYELTCPTPKSVRNMLGSGDGSMLSVYSGEYYFNRFTVNFLVQRGSDNGVTLRYGKNLTSLTVDEDASTLYSGVYPFWRGTVTEKDANGQEVQNEKCIELPEKIIAITEDAPKNVYLMDLSSDYTSWPSDEAVREIVQKYISDNALGLPFSSLKVSYEQLSKSNEYSSFINFDSVELGDYVTVEYGALLSGPQKVRCTKISYDVLLDKINSIDLGSESTLTDFISQQQSTLSNSTNYTREYVQEQLSNIPYDTALSTTSTNAVQNKVVTSKFNEMKRCCNEVKGDIAYLKEFVSSAGGTLSYGTDIPTGGKDGDGYVQVAQSSSTNPITLSVGNNTGSWAVSDFTASNKKYSFNITGFGIPGTDVANIDAVNLTPNHEYRVNFTAKMSSNATYYNDGRYTFGVNVSEFNSLIMNDHNNITRGTYDSSRRYQSFYEDNMTHNYSFVFRTDASENKISLSFSFHDVQDDNQVTLDVTNFTLVDTSSGDNEIIDLWFKIDGEWLVYSNESAFTYGYSLPTGGSDGDAYVQITSTPKDPTAIMTEGLIHNNFEVSNFTRSGSKFSFDISGTVDLTEENYTAVNIENLTPGREYRATFKINHNVPTSSLDSSYYRAGGSRWRRGFGFFINNGSNTKNINYAPTNPDNLWFANNLGFNEIRGWEGELLSVKSTKNYIPNIKFQHIYKDAGEQSYDLYFTPNSDKACLQFVFDDMVDEASCDMTVSDFEITYAGIPIINMDSYGLSGSVFASAVWNSNWDAGQGIADYIPNESWTNWGGGNGEDNVIFGFSFTESQEMDRLRLNAWEGTEFDQPRQPVLRTLYLEGSVDSKAWNAEDKEWVNLLPSNSSVNIDYGWNNIDHIYFDINKGTYHDIRCRFVNNGNGKVEALQCFLRDEVQNENHVKDLFFKCDGEWLVYPRDDQEDESTFTYGSEDPDGTTEGNIYAKVNDGAIDSISYKVNDAWLLGPSGGGGGGSGGGGVTRETIWTGNANGNNGNVQGPYTTSKSIEDYDMLIFYHIYDKIGDQWADEAHIFFVDSKWIANNNYATTSADDGNFEWTYYTSMYVRGKFTDANTFYVWFMNHWGTIFRIDGIKFSGSGGSGGGGGSERTDLLYSASGTTAPNTITLAHPYTDYEKLVVIVQTPAPAGNIGVASNTYYIDDFDTIEIIGGCSDIAYIWYSLTNATTLIKASESDGYYIKSIRGIGSGS